MADLTPNNREEAWLKGMVDGSTTLTPNNRREHWYQEIVNAGGGGGGGGGGVLKVNITWNEDYSTGTLDKTYAEILSAFQIEFVISISEESGAFALFLVTEVGYINEEYCVNILPMNNPNHPMSFVAESENSYPVFSV